ncbi:carbamoyltransferase C-terminal domain-containing protein [Selenomonas sp. AB3002]|uniref:carbamoyltransferase family protein n=1 Tax=Selenomonas sp. AB3002 TaxID=1392502 RepID=UPI00068DFE98
METFVLGLNIGNHDSAAALIRNGELISFIEQERISRNKLALGEAPVEAIMECLNSAGISMNDVSAISIGMDWNYRNKVYEMSEEEKAKYTIFEDKNRFLPRHIFGEKLPPIYPIRHHLSHAASAYRLSGYKECAILVVDNRGEDASTSLGLVNNNGEISFFKQVNIQNSLGIFYNRAARYAGLYGKYREVGKFMGLASYGKPTMKMPLEPSRDKLLFKCLPSVENEGIFNSINIRTEQLAKYFLENCFPYQSGNNDEIMSYANFAASAQKALEDVLLDFVAELKDVTTFDSLVIAGGIALNCSANGKIEQSGLFKNIFIPPFASDAGTAVGSALELYYQLYGKPFTNTPLVLSGLGISYTDDYTKIVLKNYNDKVKYFSLEDKELYDYVAKLIAEEKIVGWMQGAFEAGPRALGYRSILADPRNRRSLIKLNTIKQREMWRPIAPSIMIEKYTEYFDGQPESKYFMNVAAMVKENKRRDIAATVHVDNTARPQAVTPAQIRYYSLLNAFYKLTGVPVLCNTSFNNRGEPLVNTPKDAIECFLKMNLDVLVIGNLIIEKG